MVSNGASKDLDEEPAFIKKICFKDGVLDLYRRGSCDATWITGRLEYMDGEVGGWGQMKQREWGRG